MSCQRDVRSKAKGVDHARPLFRLDHYRRRGRGQRRHFRAHRADAGSGASSFRHAADASFSAENTLGRTGPTGNLDGCKFDTPLWRPARYANQEFFTKAQREELDRVRSAVLANNQRQDRGSEVDVAGAYNGVFLTVKRTGPRTSMIVDPPNGQVPSLTPEAANAAAADREFYLALLQATETCKTKSVECSGGKYDPTPSPRWARAGFRFAITWRHINRNDESGGPLVEDRCLTSGLPEA